MDKLLLLLVGAAAGASLAVALHDKKVTQRRSVYDKTAGQHPLPGNRASSPPNAMTGIVS